MFDIQHHFILYFQQQRPLTRYLPIRNENFDLRAHIESAGHQTDLCSQGNLFKGIDNKPVGRYRICLIFI